MAKKGDIKGFFPPISRRDITPVVSQVGRWESEKGSSFLELLIHAMPPGMNLSLADLVSLPHIWGQTVAFTAAWEDDSHPMHKTVLGEWRGLLALIGLTVWEDWPVRALKVDIIDLAERPFVTSAGVVSDNVDGQRHGNFPKVVRDYIPDRAAMNVSEWNNSAVILYDHNAGSRKESRIDARPIAFCVPKSLVVPARNYENVIDSRIPWRANKRGGYPLQDPSLRDGRHYLSPVQAAVLEQYLKEVLDKSIRGAFERDRASLQVGRAPQAAASDSREDRGLNILKRRLEEYIKAVQLIQSNPTSRTFQLRPTSESLDGWNTDWFNQCVSPYFDALASVPQRPQENIARDTVIPCKRDRKEQFKGVVLFGEPLKDKNGRKGGDISVWGPHTLKDLGDKPIHFNRQNSRSEEGQDYQPELMTQNVTRLRVYADAKRKGYLLLHINELFYPDIMQVKEAPAHHPVGWGTWLPPLRPVALALFSPEYLYKHLVIDELGDKIEVTIKLDGIEGSGQALQGRIGKTFPRKHGGPPQQPSTLAIWPDFNSSEWHHYYIFHIGVPDREIDIRPVPAVEEWLPLFYADWQDRDNVNAFFEALSTNPKLVATSEEMSHAIISGRDEYERSSNLVGASEEGEQDRRLRTHWLSRPPEALVGIYTSEPTSNVSHPNSGYGLILPKPPKSLQLSDKPAIIGLDIGSTNTSAAWLLPGINDADGKRFQVEIKSTLSFVFLSSSLDAIKIEETFGVPQPSYSAPYLSLLRERRPVATRSVPHPFAHYRIPWQILTKRDFSVIKPNSNGSETFVCNLKWMQRDARSDSNFESVERYLWLVMLLVGAGVIRNGFSLRTTEWRFSYPDTFTTAEVDSYRDIIDRLNHKLHYPHVEKLSFIPPQVRRTYAIREYQCTGKYFLSRYNNVARSNTVIIFDIGGHNTDISIWRSNVPHWNATLALASQDTLVDFMMKNSDLFNQIFPNHWDNYDTVLKSSYCGDDFKRMATEVFIQDKDFSVWQDRMSGPQRDMGRISQLRDMTTFTMLGLLYYTAISYVECIVDTSKSPDQLPPIQFCFGGNGSLLFKSFIDRNQHPRIIEWFYTLVEEFTKRKFAREQPGGTAPQPLPDNQSRWVCPPFIFSDHPKHEVSEGLLTWLPMELERQVKIDPPSNSGAVRCCTISAERPPLYIGDAIRVNDGLKKNDDEKNNDKERSYFDRFDNVHMEQSGWEIGELSEVKEFLKLCEERFRIFPKITEDEGLAASTPVDQRIEHLIRLIRASVQRALDEECRQARNDFRRYHRNGDSLTYQPQPVFILALKDIIRQWNKQNQRPMG